MKKYNRYSLWIFLILLLQTGCSSSSTKDRYKLANDVAPENPISVENIEDAHPKYEPFSQNGNKDYSLRGKKYNIIKQPQGFTETGYASWYGNKFHGHLTSNGDIYDMYSMTAAHKTLPIPSYIRVTNTNNGKTVIVRVNDRGPFHDDRIIDLSYAAAYKIGVYQHGTAPVKIKYISVPQSKIDIAYAKQEYLIQVAAISNSKKARTLAERLGQTYSTQYQVDNKNGYNRIMLGPWVEQSKANHTLIELQKNGYPSAYLRHRDRKLQGNNKT